MPSYLSYKRQIAVLDENNDDITWITVKGNHIPIKKGQNKGEAVKEFFEKKNAGSKSEKVSKKPEKETRMSLALKIAALVKPTKISEKEYARRLVNGVGALKGSSLGELQKLYERRKSDAESGGKKTDESGFEKAKSVIKTVVGKEYRQSVERILDNAKKSAENKDITVSRVIKDAVALKKFSAKDIESRIANYEKYRDDVKKNNDGVLVDTAMKNTVGGRWEKNEKGKEKYVWDSWKPERLKLWEDILGKEQIDGKWVDIDWEAKKPAQGERPRIVLLGGRGGSGKSKFTDDDKPLGDDSFDKRKFLVIDPDEYKTQLPEYKSLVDSGSKFGGLNAWEVHEESSAMKKMQLNRALERGVNVILDGTMAQYGSVKKVLDKFKESDYIVDVAFMELPREQSAVRGVGRAMRVNPETGVPSGRYVPTDLMLGMTGCEENFINLIPDADNWVLYENTGKNPSFVARGGKSVKKV